ncbi:MurR/RpiR family transcriptional regulator [Kluyvera intermedia]|uniref:MurR/RpiR family transcriptional regulator n=1 Tax=Kluyvera intermedia TaxID=61648 RepID=UPI001F478319|nr:MurR/RpiR family transcriptional regulator [Kluyvera intermedia]MCE9889922.1 MurR/RpiR family transcriptional regulator [Kluyvera intermedia]
MRKDLTSNELRIYKFCQENPTDVYKMKIHELAERVYTTAPSISKLVKKLGFNNFQEFKVDVRDVFSMSKNSQHHNSFVNEYIQEMQDALTKVSESKVKAFCDFLSGCSTIITWGYGTSDSVANYVSYNLMVLGFNILNETDYTNCNVRSRFLTANDCVLIVSNSGESEMLEDIILNARKNGIKVAAITSRANSTLALKADAVLIYKNAIIKDTAFENISYPIQIAIIDIMLFHLSNVRKVSLKFNSKVEDS